MVGRKRRTAQVIGRLEALAIAANLARDARATRRRRKLTQAALGALVGLSQAEVSRLERGNGAGASIDTWVAIGIALARPVAIGFSRDTVQPLNDAGHLDAQELVARLTAVAGWQVEFEARDRLGGSGGSTDLRLRRDGVTVLTEIWNRFDDLGAAVRSSDRKLAGAPDGARLLWLLVDTGANHAIVRRYPAIFRARFPGSSAAWVRALTSGAPPPTEPGIAWIDVRSGRLRPLRLASGTGA